MVINVGDIFRERPMQWRLRGDPYLWDDLEKYFSNIKRPLTVEELEKEIKAAIYEFSGQDIETNSFIYVERYNHGGMSGGSICQEFWLKKALPTLLERFLSMCKEMEE